MIYSILWPHIHVPKGTSVSSVQLLSHLQLFATPWTAARLSITNSRSLLKLMSIKSVMPSNYFILCHPLLLLPSIFPSIRVFSNESVISSYSQFFSDGWHFKTLLLRGKVSLTAVIFSHLCRKHAFPNTWKDSRRKLVLLLRLSCLSRVWLCATP